MYNSSTLTQLLHPYQCRRSTRPKRNAGRADQESLLCLRFQVTTCSHSLSAPRCTPISITCDQCAYLPLICRGFTQFYAHSLQVLTSTITEGTSSVCSGELRSFGSNRHPRSCGCSVKSGRTGGALGRLARWGGGRASAPTPRLGPAHHAVERVPDLHRVGVVHHPLRRAVAAVWWDEVAHAAEPVAQVVQIMRVGVCRTAHVVEAGKQVVNSGPREQKDSVRHARPAGGGGKGKRREEVRQKTWWWR